MANEDKLNMLFDKGSQLLSGNADKLSKRELYELLKLGQKAGRYSVGSIYGAIAPQLAKGIRDSKIFNTSLKAYQDVAYDNFLRRLGRKPTFAEAFNEKQREYRDFSRLYAEKHPKSGNKPQQIMRNIVANSNPLMFNTKPKAKQLPQKTTTNEQQDTSKGKGQTKISTNSGIKSVAGYNPKSVGEVADMLRNPSKYSNFEPIDYVESYRDNVPVLGGGIPIGTNMPTLPQGLPTGGASGITTDDIVALARNINTAKNKAYSPSMNDLQGLIDNYYGMQKESFYKDLGLAAVAGLSGNNAYAQMMGKYTPTAQERERLALQQEMDRQKAEQVFNPLPMMGNMEVASRLGLSPIGGLADKDKIGAYSNITTAQLNNEAARQKMLAAYNQAIEIQKMKDAQAEADREIARYKAEHPAFNTLASQAQMASALLGNAAYIPELKNQLTPEAIQYMMNLTGFTGSGATQPQQVNIPNPKATGGGTSFKGGRY